MAIDEILFVGYDIFRRPGRKFWKEKESLNNQRRKFREGILQEAGREEPVRRKFQKRKSPKAKS